MGRQNEEVACMKEAEEQIVLHQQIALNNKMYKIGKVSKSLHERANKALQERIGKNKHLRRSHDL